MENVLKFDVAKKKTLNAMMCNDVFEYRELGPIAFKRWKRGGKSFEAIQISTKKQYSCRVGGYNPKEYDVIGVYNPPKVKTDIDKLKEGDLFVIPVKKDAILLKFMHRKPSGKVVASNPLDETQVFNVDESFTMTLLENLPK